MAPNPESFLRHLQELGYHPRSDKHSNCLSECIVDDLIKNCQAIRRKAAEGRLVYELNFTLLTGTADLPHLRLAECWSLRDAEAVTTARF
jgi:hypothetical protein